MRLKFNLQSSSSGTHTAIFPFQLFPRFNPTHVQSTTSQLPSQPWNHQIILLGILPSGFLPHAAASSQHGQHTRQRHLLPWTSLLTPSTPSTSRCRVLHSELNVKWALMSRVKKASWSSVPCVSRGREQLCGEVPVHALRCGNQCLLQIKPAMPTITVLCCCCPSTFQVIL